MAGKFTFALGLGAGYILGTRAGRAQYERMKAAAVRMADKPFVRERVDAASAKATAFVRQQGEVVTDKVVDAVKERLFGTPKATTPSEPITVDDAEVRSV